MDEITEILKKSGRLEDKFRLFLINRYTLQLAVG